MKFKWNIYSALLNMACCGMTAMVALYQMYVKDDMTASMWWTFISVALFATSFIQVKIYEKRIKDSNKKELLRFKNNA